MSRKVDFVKDINDSKETWRLAVRIMDVWSVVNNKGIEHLEMIVMDSLGDRIQVLIRHDHLLKWKEVIKENMTCIINNDNVYNNDFQWKNGEDDPMVYPDELEMLLNKKMTFRIKSKTEYAKLVPNKENLETSAQTLSASGENDPESIILMTPAKDVVIADKGEEVDFEASGATQLSGTKPSKKLKIEPSS
ncbi:hypothetical protein KIW84_075671 [Lathyrus oleraceus]|uniref:Replication protein A 70 kDa DNA-binding subunit B/D first OB fold domain-containing protein n=1 Tax=Pisum sativum TaxID=3888 RepID=A0A9D4VVX3_PEA|nr:hypothetical protein KIW84_075671 [Pisum sativum]